MKLITWNIQWGLGMDGHVDLERIVRTARAFADFDVLCLQEVTDNYGSLQGNDGANQFDAFRALLPDMYAVEGVAVERYTPGLGRQRFGNMVFSRWPVLQAFRHQLPWPAEPADVPTMPRMALEVVLQAPDGALRVTTTHLEFYSRRQRTAQVGALRAIHADATGHNRNIDQPHKHGSPFETRARGTRAVLTGDFNCLPDDEALALLQAPAAGVPPYVDAWRLVHGAQPHAPTANVHSAVAPHKCLDFVLVSADMASQVRALDVQNTTSASDHQPLLLETNL